MKRKYYKSFLFPLTLTGTFASLCHAVPNLSEIREEHFLHGSLLRIPVGFSQGTLHHLEIDLNASVADIHSKISDKRQSMGLSQKIPLTEQQNFLTLFPWAKASLEHEKSLMPGQIIHMFVKEGDRVERGDPLFIVTAFKMESTIRASSAGRINKIFVEEGEFVEADSDILCTLPLLENWDDLDPSFLHRNRYLFEPLFPWASKIEPQTYLTNFQDIESLKSVLEPVSKPSAIPLEETAPHPPIEVETSHGEDIPTFTPRLAYDERLTSKTLPNQFNAPVNMPIQNQRYLFQTSEVHKCAEIHFHNMSYDLPHSTRMIPTQRTSMSSPLKLEEENDLSKTKTKSFSKFVVAGGINSQRGYFSLCLAAVAALFMYIFKNKKTQFPLPTHNVIRADFSQKRCKNTLPIGYQKAA